MRRLVLAATILCYPLTATAALTLQEVRTASNTVIEVYFTSTTMNTAEVNTADLTQWTVNGTPVTAINKYVMSAVNPAVNPALSADHHIFLTVPPLVSGTTYQVQTPNGSATLAFDDHKTLCESIKVNQSAYSALSVNRREVWCGQRLLLLNGSRWLPLGGRLDAGLAGGHWAPQAPIVSPERRKDWKSGTWRHRVRLRRVQFAEPEQWNFLCRLGSIIA